MSRADMKSFDGKARHAVTWTNRTAVYSLLKDIIEDKRRSFAFPRLSQSATDGFASLTEQLEKISGRSWESIRPKLKVALKEIEYQFKQGDSQPAEEKIRKALTIIASTAGGGVVAALLLIWANRMIEFYITGSEAGICPSQIKPSLFHSSISPDSLFAIFVYSLVLNNIHVSLAYDAVPIPRAVIVAGLDTIKELLERPPSKTREEGLALRLAARLLAALLKVDQKTMNVQAKL